VFIACLHRTLVARDLVLDQLHLLSSFHPNSLPFTIDNHSIMSNQVSEIVLKDTQYEEFLREIDKKVRSLKKELANRNLKLAALYHSVSSRSSLPQDRPSHPLSPQEQDHKDEHYHRQEPHYSRQESHHRESNRHESNYYPPYESDRSENRRSEGRSSHHQKSYVVTCASEHKLRLN
jgi:hypothetical protein